MPKGHLARLIGRVAVTKMTDDDRWMWQAIGRSTASKDPSRKTGCVFVSRNGEDVTSGFNRFPFGVAVTSARMERPAKYVFTEHAERVAIYKAAKRGYSLASTTAYLNWFPCADCARALAEVGVLRLVCFEPDWTEDRYGFREAKEILDEVGVTIEYLDREKFKT